MPATLTIIGTALVDTDTLNPRAAEALATADLIIGESEKLTSMRLKSLATQAAVYCLDEAARPDLVALDRELAAAAKGNRSVVLFSDTGMPILFDPGKLVYDRCRDFGMTIKCVPGPTSWGTAAALSGWEPPFLLVGFPPRETAERQAFWAKHAGSMAAHQIILDTPYRYKKTIAELPQFFSAPREVFVAWQIGYRDEKYFWTPVRELGRQSEIRGLNKGEFILIIRGNA